MFASSMISPLLYKRCWHKQKSKIREALFKSAAADGERFFVKARFGGKNPSSAVADLFRASFATPIIWAMNKTQFAHMILHCRRVLSYVFFLNGTTDLLCITTIVKHNIFCASVRVLSS